MRKRLKKYLSLTIVLSIIISVCSCSGPSATATTAAPATTESQATAEAASTSAEGETQATEESISKWEPKLSAEDKAIVEKLGTLTHHTKVTEDSLNWSFDAASGTLTVTGQGPMKDYSKDDPSPAKDYVDSVTRIVVGDGITTIGAYAFYNMMWCENARLPDSVEYIGDYAFMNDSSLEEMPFPKGLREIGDYAFGEVKLHKALVIPEGIEIIGKHAFNSNDFYDNISIPASAYYIAETAFYNSLSLHDFTVAEGNPNYTAKDGVLFSKDLAVLFCYPIYKEEKHYDIPQTVTRIAEGAFEQNYFLKTIHIPASVSEVGDRLFLEFPFMEEYTVDENCPVLKSMDGVLYSKDMKMLYDYPRKKEAEEYTVPASVETIDRYCFDFCDKTKKLYIPGTVKKVDRCAFGFTNGEIYLAKDFVNAEIGDSILYSITTESRMDFSEDYVYTPPEKREPEANPVVYLWTHHDKMTVYYEGSQEEWDAFIEKGSRNLGDTEVICNTPFPGK